MKIKLVLVNLAFIVLVTGLLFTVGVSMQSGAILVLAASTLFLTVYILQIVRSIRHHTLWRLDNLLYSFAILISAIIFIHDFSVSIGMPFLGNIQIFNIVFLVTGLLLILLFLAASIQAVKKLENSRKRLLLNTVHSTVSGISVLGLFGISGLLPFSGWLITYSLLFLILFYLVFFIFQAFIDSKEQKVESSFLAVLSIATLFFLITRFYFPQILPRDLAHMIIIYGFMPALLLPLSINFIKVSHFFTVFIVYFIFLDLYFLHTDRNFQYLVNVGINGCVGYEDATTYPVNTDPGVPIEDLLKEPEEVELNAIRTEWQKKDFTPMQIQDEHKVLGYHGDTIKVVSHSVNGQKHYGLIRIPKGIDMNKAPILLGLMGGGTGLDVLKISDLYQLSSGQCRDLLDRYITIMPTFRGNIVRGEDFCFRSEGYPGDVWLGAAEDAVSFLEVVKHIYHKDDSTGILALGVSRGATVALIIGGLTDKIDYIISNSTHTQFLDPYVVRNERVGGSYSRAFYTPSASHEMIRKRILASSPLYFSNHLPAFEIHQGTEDQKTTVRHTRLLENKLKEMGRDNSTYHIYLYEGKGHGFDDDNIVCNSLGKFLDN